MEDQGYRLINDSTRESVERTPPPRQFHYNIDDVDDDKSNVNGDGSSRCLVTANRRKAKAAPERISSGGSARFRMNEKYSNITYDKKAPPLSTEQMHQSSSSRKYPPSKDSSIRESTNKCIENNFDFATISSAKSIAYSLVNPCGPTTKFFKNSNLGNQHPLTPSTAGSSFSDESQSSVGCSLETSPSHEARSSRSVISIAGRSVPPASATDSNAEDGDMIVFVGNQQYQFPSSGGRRSFASNYFLTHRKFRDNFSYVDLSTHSPEEFRNVMDFFENNTTTDAWSNIHWKNISIILPWLVEFEALPLVNAADTFLLHNGVSALVDRGYSGESSNRYQSVSFSSLLSLTQIAFACGLQNTKSYVRRFLRIGLLEPRKQTSNPECGNNQSGEAGEDIELQWSLQDLRVLAQVLQNHDDLREYLWEVAVIIYLPHDLDISDSMGLVSNALFPYLLREGMMQMMIVEGIESSNPTNDNSFLTESSGNSKILGSSFSEHTSCSDTTIPTTPSSRRNSLTDKQLQHYFQSILKHLEKFKAEKEARRSSLVVDQVMTSPGRTHGIRENSCVSTTTSSRGMTTFAC